MKQKFTFLLALLCTVWIGAKADGVAKIGDTEYATLAEAVKAATSGQTITLTADIADAGKISLPAGVTFDGQSHKLSGNSTVYIAVAGGTVKNVDFENITNNVAPTAANVSRYGFVNKTGTLSCLYASKLSGTATITGCTFNNVDWDAIQMTPVAGANISITGCSFNTDAACQTLRFVHVQSEQNVDFTINVSGNKFYGVKNLNQTGLEVYYPTDAKKVTLSGNYMDAPMGVCILTGSGVSHLEYSFPFKDETLTNDVTVVASTTDKFNNDKLFTNLSDALAAALSSKTVKMWSDVALTSTVTNDKNLTIDLNGHNISSTDCRALWQQEGTLTLTGKGTISASHTDGNTSFASSSSVVRVGDNAGTAAGLVVDKDVTISTDYCYGVTYFGTDAQTVTIDGTVAVTGEQSALSGNGTSTMGEATVTVNGTVSSEKEYAIYHPEAGTLTINGTVTGKGGIEMKGGSLVVNSGATVTATATEQSHGLNNDGCSTSGYAIANVYNPNYKGNISITVNEGATVNGEQATINDYVAKIGTTYYASLADAVDAVPATNTETTITLLNSTEGSGVKVVAGKNIVFDLNKCTYTVVSPTVGSKGTETNAFQLLQGSTVTFKNGELESKVAKIFLQNYCNLTLDNVVINAQKNSQMNYALSDNNGTVTIKDSKIYGSTGHVAFDVCRYSTYTGPSVTVAGSSVIDGTIEISCSGAKEGAQHVLTIESGDLSNATLKVNCSHSGALCPNFSIYKADAVTLAPVAGYAWVESSKSGYQTLASTVAKIGTTNYASLTDAVAAATDNQTVTLLSDVTLSSARVDVEKSITIDLNKKTVTPTTACANGSAFNIVSGTVTIKNGTIDGSSIDGVTNSQSLPYGKEVDLITVRSGATLNVDGLTATVNSTTGSCLYAFTGGTINVIGGTYTNNATGVGPANEKSMCLNQGDVDTQYIFVTGGTFKGADPKTGDNSGKMTNFCATGYTSVANTDGTYTVAKAQETVKSSNYTEPTDDAAKTAIDNAIANNAVANAVNDVAANADVPAGAKASYIDVVLSSAETSTSVVEGKTVVTSMTFDVTPKYIDAEGNTQNLEESAIKSAITFRLPVDANVNYSAALVKHNNVEIGYYPVLGDATNGKYIEVSLSSFSPVSYSLTDVTGSVYAGNAAEVTGQTIAQFNATREDAPNAIMIVDSKYADVVEGQANIIVNNNGTYSCSNFVLTDLENFYTPYDFTAVSGSYTRSLHANGSTCCLPFEVSSGNGIQVQTFKDSNDDCVYVQNAESSAAGTPCLIYCESATTYTKTFNNTDIVANDKISNNTLIGTFTASSAYSTTGYYGMLDNGTEFGLGPNTLSPFRAVLKLGGNGAKARRIVFLGSDDETAINSISSDISAKKDIYTIGGVKVSEIKHSGLYIINGKKTFVK